MEMMNNNITIKQKGFTITELLIVSFLSVFVLMMVYQVSSGAINLFLSTKSNSDSLESKAPAMEVISRYFERRGVAVVTGATGLGLQTSPKYIDAVTNTQTGVGSSGGHHITFYSNLGGFGVVRSVSGTAPNLSITLTSCRLNDVLPAHRDSSSKCYYIYRGTSATQTPSNLDNDNNAVGDGKLDSISFPSISSANVTSQCVDPNFVLSTPNLTTTTNASDGIIVDQDGTVTGATPITLQEGDYIFRSHYKIELYIKQNSSDNNRKWLYSKLTNVAGACGRNSSDQDQALEEALAPAEKITLDSPTTLPETTGLVATVTVLFRNEFKGNTKPKYFSVTRTFGG
jgi:hypothetical protein